VTDQAELEPRVPGALPRAPEGNTFERNEIKIHSMIRVTRSSTVERPSSRENADADPMPPMNAIGATYARNSPDRGALAQAGHINANPRSGAGKALVARRLLATT